MKHTVNSTRNDAATADPQALQAERMCTALATWHRANINAYPATYRVR